MVIGREMIDVTDYAKKRSIPFVLIDANYFEISKRMKEELGIIGKIFIAINYLLLVFSPKKKILNRIVREYKKLQKFSKEKIEKMKKSPLIKGLVWREDYMIEKILPLCKKYNNLLVVVGDFHCSPLKEKLISQGIQHKIEIIRADKLLSLRS